MPDLLGLIDLAEPDPKVHRRVPGLARLLSRSGVQAEPPGTAEQMCQCFGMTLPDGSAPVAALTGPVDTGQRDDVHWLRMDPVHLAAGAREIVMTDPAELRLDARANQVLGEACVRHLADEGVRLEVGPDGRWYLLLAEAPDLITHPPGACVGRDIGAFLPTGGEARLWRRRLTELQMVLTTNPVNVDREQRGLPIVNSVWPWGGGRLPEPAPSTSGTAFGNDILLAALARWAGWRLMASPAGYLPLATACRTETAVVLLGTDSISMQPAEMPGADPGTNAGADAFALIERLEQDWFGPVEGAVRGGRIETLRLYPGHGLSLSCTRSTLRRFWHRPRLGPPRRPVS